MLTAHLYNVGPIQAVCAIRPYDSLLLLHHLPSAVHPAESNGLDMLLQARNELIDLREVGDSQAEGHVRKGLLDGGIPP
jgi:hypothetical protein